MALLDTLADLRTAVRSLIQEPTAALRSNADIDLYLNLWLRRVAEQSRYFVVKVSGSTVSGTSDYALDSGTFSITRWIEHLGIQQIVYDATSSAVELKQARERDLPALRAASGTGPSSQFWIYNKTLELFPTPNAAKTLEIYTWQYPAEKSGATDTTGLPISKNEILVYGAAAMALEKDEHPDALYYERKAAALLAEWVTDLEEGEERHRQEGLYLDPSWHGALRFGR